MSFGRVVYNDKRKTKFNSQKICSKVKVTGVKKLLKNHFFKLLPQLLKKLLTDFDEHWQDGIE